MRRFSVFLSLMVVVLFVTLGLHAQPIAVAQEATPAAEGFTEEGITFEPLALATELTFPATGELSISRVSFDPGAGFPIEEGDPSYALAAGDTVLFPPDVGGEIRNDSQVRTVVLVAFVGPPVTEGTPTAGTPTP